MSTAWVSITAYITDGQLLPGRIEILARSHSCTSVSLYPPDNWSMDCRHAHLRIWAGASIDDRSGILLVSIPLPNPGFLSTDRIEMKSCLVFVVDLGKLAIEETMTFSQGKICHVIACLSGVCDAWRVCVLRVCLAY